MRSPLFTQELRLGLQVFPSPDGEGPCSLQTTFVECNQGEPETGHLADITDGQYPTGPNLLRKHYHRAEQ